MGGADQMKHCVWGQVRSEQFEHGLVEADSD